MFFIVFTICTVGLIVFLNKVNQKVKSIEVKKICQIKKEIKIEKSKNRDLRNLTLKDKVTEKSIHNKLQKVKNEILNIDFSKSEILQLL